MPAFKDSVLNRLRENIRELYLRRSRIGRLTLTHEEYLATFAPREARDLLAAAAPYVEKPNGGVTFWLRYDNGEQVKLWMWRDTSPDRPAPPAVRQPTIQPDAPAEVLERFDTWLSRGGNISRDYGRVAATLYKLNELCKSPSQIRFFWPSIMQICAEHETTRGIGDGLQTLRSPQGLVLPAGLQKACRLTTETLSTVALLDKDTPEAPYGEVNITCTEGQKYEEPDLGEYHGM